MAALPIFGQTTIVGALQSYNEETRGTERLQQYWPNDGAFECESTLDEFLQGKKGRTVSRGPSTAGLLTTALRRATARSLLW